MKIKNRLNKIANIFFVLLLIGNILNILFFVYFSYLFNTKGVKKLPFKYVNSSKSIDYIFSLKDSNVFYDQKNGSFYLYNSKLNKRISNFAKIKNLENLNLVLLKNKDVNVSNIYDDTYIISKNDTCNKLSLLINYKEEDDYSKSLNEDVKSWNYCYSDLYEKYTKELL